MTMKIRVTYRCEVYIEGNSVEDCKSKFDKMPLFNPAAEIYNPSFVEISSAERVDDDSYTDVMNEFDY